MGGCNLLTGPGQDCEGSFVQTVEPVRTEVVGDSSSSATVLVDLHLPYSESQPRPTTAQLEQVRAHGGLIHRAFQVQAVRAEIRLDGLYELLRAPGGPLRAVTVPDPVLHTVLLSVKHVEEERIVGLFTRLGGIVTHENASHPYIRGWIDDTAIACLKADERVLLVQHWHSFSSPSPQ